MNLTFIGIGAQKCASTWLYDVLADHPDVALSEKKELNFFSYHYEKGYAWYEGQFPDKPGAKAVGEISTSYFNEASVPERVRLYSPDLRILLSLREPVERALSQHRHQIRVGEVLGPDYSFEKALADNPSYIEQGRYATHLSRWLAIYPPNQIHVALMEDIKENPEETARKVYEFLGVTPNHRSAALYQKSNASYAVRHRGIESAVKTLRSMAKRAGLEPVWQGLGRLGARRWYGKLNRKTSEAVMPSPLPETLKQLHLVFRDDILALERLLGRDLQKWL